jgi:hypothetical protein
MALITPDFTEVQDTVGIGTYKVRVVDAKAGEWPAKEDRAATPFINWQMKTFAESEEKNNGRSIFLRTPISGKGAFKLRDLYRACIGQDLTGNFDTEQLFGKEVEVTVTERNGYNEVSTIRRLT